MSSQETGLAIGVILLNIITVYGAYLLLGN